MKKINLDGDVWNVLSEGVKKDGQTFCHLASTTRGKHQKNGFYPVQSCRFVDSSLLESKSDVQVKAFSRLAN